MSWVGLWVALALLLPLALPLAMLLPAARRLSLLPLVPLPALGLGVAGLAGLPVAVEAPGLLLGVALAPGAPGLLMLAVTAVVWVCAGLHAAAVMEGGWRGAVFAGFWGVTLAGNLGVFLAADVVSFYLAFAAVSLAAWGLVIHERTDEALRAGRLYMLMAVLGEVALLLGLIIGAQAAGGTGIAALREAGAGGPVGVALLLVGLGIKAGLVPVHLWLPLAHPAAPVAASAVLSGTIVKAGVFGVLLLVPDAGGLLAPLGLAGAFAAALYGLSQSNPKAVLAYSTVSQMSLLLGLIGAGLGPALAALYAAHHALAKAAMFLSVGGVMAGWRRLAGGTALLAALSVAGAPLTGGALAKAAAKAALPGWAETALTLSGVTTGLLLVWFLLRLQGTTTKSGPEGPGVPLAVGAVALGALALPWALAGWTGLPQGYALGATALVDAGWPLAVALGLAGLAAVAGLRLPSLPPGDLVVLAPLWARLRRVQLPQPPDAAALRQEAGRLAEAAGAAAGRLERGLLLWRWAGLLILSLLLGLALAAG